MDQQTLYRIYTEDGPEFRQNVAEQVNKWFQAYTLIEAVGVWNGSGEQTIVVEIIADSSELIRATIKRIAETIKASNNQQAVLVTESPVTSFLY